MDNNPVRVILDVAYQARKDLDGDQFSETILLSPHEQFFHSVQNDLLDNDVDIAPTVSEYFSDDDDPEIASLLVCLFEYIALVNWDDGGSSDPAGEHEALMTLLKQAQKIFVQRGSNVSWFIPVLRKISAYLVRSASKLDASIGNPYLHKHVEELTRVLHTSYSHAAADNAAEPERRGATFFLANLIFQMYFELDNIRLCETIMKNLEKQLPRLEEFPLADQTMFRFWRGRIHLSQQKLRPAVEELTKAFEMCTNENMANKRLILLYATAASLPLGILPHPALLREFTLEQQFGPLIRAMKKGNIALFHGHITRWRKFLAKRGLWLLLREKCEVLVWRSLIRRTYLCGPPERANETPPNIRVKDITVALRMSSRDPSYTVDDVECMICSLLDQRYILGYYHHSKQTLVLLKPPKPSTSLASRITAGFPPPSSVVVQDAGDDDERPSTPLLPLSS